MPVGGVGGDLRERLAQAELSPFHWSGWSVSAWYPKTSCIRSGSTPCAVLVDGVERRTGEHATEIEQHRFDRGSHPPLPILPGAGGTERARRPWPPRWFVECRTASSAAQLRSPTSARRRPQERSPTSPVSCGAPSTCRRPRACVNADQLGMSMNASLRGDPQVGVTMEPGLRGRGRRRDRHRTERHPPQALPRPQPDGWKRPRPCCATSASHDRGRRCVLNVPSQ